jgi:cell division protease FtsH
MMKNLLVWVAIAAVMIAAYQAFVPTAAAPKKVPFSEFLVDVSGGKVKEVVIQERQITGTNAAGEKFETYAPDYPDLVKDLSGKGVRIEAKPPKDQGLFIYILINFAPFVLLFIIWMAFMRQMQSGGNKALSFGKSRAKVVHREKNKVTFADVAGVDEAKEELHEIIDFLKDPHKFQKLGGKIPKGVLLVGPPGTGKTLLAKAIAGEADVPFFSISGSEFVEMFVGVGASRVRDLFEQGKKNAPCIIFIDEIDAVGRHRGAGLGGGHDEREQTLNQLLVEMDGFDTTEGVIMICATNRPDVLDPALLRSGRFDRQVVVPRPDLRGRTEILKVHAKKVLLAPGTDMEVIARGTPGFSGADLANLVNEAALLAARLDKKEVELSDFEIAKDKVLMGVERRSIIISPKEKRITAYHEAGHALVARHLPGTDPIHKVTIIPRGRALGLTQQLPIDDRYTYNRDYLLNNITVALGGRAAEEIVLKEQTTGAGDDIDRATRLARKMVCDWGMSEALGPVTFGKEEEQIFLGREISQHRDYSEQTAQVIDAEVKRIVLSAHDKAVALLTEHLDQLNILAAKLLEKEVLSGPEIDTLLGTGPTEPAAGDAPGEEG